MKKSFFIYSLAVFLSSCTPVKFGSFSSEKSAQPTGTVATPGTEEPPSPEKNPTPSGPDIPPGPNTPTPPGPTPPTPPGPLPPSPPPNISTVDKKIDIYVQAFMTQVDILLVIDDSSSMEADNARLAARMGGFIQSLQAANLDWQMCVTTTDVDYYQGIPLVWSGTNTHLLNKNHSANLGPIIQQTVSDIGFGFSNDEQGIKASYYNIQKNAQFLCHRPQAALAVIIISDEDERSTGGIYELSTAQFKALTEENKPAHLVQYLKTTFGSEKKFKVNSIVVQDSACEAKQDAEGTPSFIGKSYLEISRLSQGASGSICEADYSQNLGLFSQQVKNTVSSVKLECVPLAQPTATNLPAGTAMLVQNEMLIFNPPLPEQTRLSVSYKCAK